MHGHDYVTKAEFERFKEGPFADLSSEVTEIRVDMAKLSGKVDVLSEKVNFLSRAVYVGAAVFAVPMLFMMYQILCTK